MAKYNVHGGHNSIVPGAASILNEVTEDRKVKNKLISLLKGAGHTVYDCTDDSGRTSGANLANIVAKCNKHSVDLDISIHLNSGRKDTKGDGSTGGVEVFCYDSRTKSVAEKITDAIAEEFGYHNRGVKYSTGLYVLRNTKSKAILIECCFVDDKDDAKVWNAEKCAAAIYKGLTGKSVSSGSSSSETKTENSGGTTGKYWANVKMEDLDRSSRTQKWIVHKHSDDTFSIKNKNSGLYLSVKDGQMKENQGVWDYSWNETNSQRFGVTVDSTGDLTTAASIRCKSDNNYVLQTDGDKLCIGKKTGKFAQRWTFIPTGLDEEYYIIAHGSGQAITDCK